MNLLGMPLAAKDDDPILAATPLCGFIVIKALDKGGEVDYYTAATDGLTTVECLGMAEYAALKLRRALERRMDDEAEDGE